MIEARHEVPGKRPPKNRPVGYGMIGAWLRIQPNKRQLNWATIKKAEALQPSFRHTGGTPMILFARSQGHARCRVQGIIGVPACVPDLAKDDNQKT